MPETYVECQGAELHRGDGADPEVFTRVNGLMSISGPSKTVSEIDITDLNSSSKEFTVGLQDNGTISVDGKYLPADAMQAGLQTDSDAKTLRNFKLIHTDEADTTYSFSAYVTEFSTSMATDDVVKVSAKLRITGDITIT